MVLIDEQDLLLAEKMDDNPFNRQIKSTKAVVSRCFVHHTSISPFLLPPSGVKGHILEIFFFAEFCLQTFQLLC